MFRFPGHLNDAQTYRMIPQPGVRPFSLPGRARLAADGRYPAGLLLITPGRNAYNWRERRANSVLRSVRVRIEHVFGFEKKNIIVYHQRLALETSPIVC